MNNVMTFEEYIEYIGENRLLYINEHNEYFIEPQPIDEALISYNETKVINHLCHTYKLADKIKSYKKHHQKYQGYIESCENKNHCSVILLALPKSHKELLKEITSSMERSCGWFLVCKLKKSLPGHECWQFEKKKDNDATSDVKSQEYIYHLCPTSRLQKILHVGLTPKKNTWKAYKLDDEHTYKDRHGQHYGWKSIDRVYAFLKKPNENFLKNNNFKKGKDIESVEGYTLLKIEVSKLKSDVEFYFDPRSEGAVFTLEPIPHSAISVVISFPNWKRFMP